MRVVQAPPREERHWNEPGFPNKLGPMSLARPSLPLPRLLRTLVLALVALAVVGKPVLAELCDAHALAHLTAAAAAAKHVDTAAEKRSDRDHASGKHQTLHSFDASAAMVELFPTLTVPPARFAAAALPVHVAEAAPARAFDSPFRPPIA